MRLKSDGYIHEGDRVTRSAKLIGALVATLVWLVADAGAAAAVACHSCAGPARPAVTHAQAACVTPPEAMHSPACAHHAQGHPGALNVRRGADPDAPSAARALCPPQVAPSCCTGSPPASVSGLAPASLRPAVEHATPDATPRFWAAATLRTPTGAMCPHCTLAELSVQRM
jgi:hypothetical protein